MMTTYNPRAPFGDVLTRLLRRLRAGCALALMAGAACVLWLRRRRG